MYSKTLVVFIVVYFLSASARGHDKKFFRDYTYIEAAGSFYKLHKTEKTWFDANQVCVQEGASLFYPENDNEAQTVVSLFENDVDSYFFFGMTDLLVPGVYENNDGNLVSELYHNWGYKEPNNHDGKNKCVAVARYSPYEIFVAGCQYESPFICKKKLQWNYSCLNFDSDYTLNSDNGKCYKLHTTPLNWTDAYTMCRAEQSYLAVINNQLEADFLANLTMFTSYPRVGGNYYRGMYHLGFHNKFRRGWMTVKGTPMNKECEVWWDNHEPITDEYNQCGSMFFNGRLNTISCDTKSFFICEHEVGKSSSFLETSTQ